MRLDVISLSPFRQVVLVWGPWFWVHIACSYVILIAKQRDSENEKGADIYLHGGTFSVVLNLRIHEMTEAKGDAIGSIAVFIDVTKNRMFIERLEVKAGMDSLTVLANHMAFEGAKKRIDTLEYLPLGVIMCDANGLKHVNDIL